MSIKTETTRITASQGGAFNAYIARPDTATKAPCIIVIQEIFGVNNDVRKKCDAWAEKGYVALAPDLFWRQQPDIQLNKLDEAEWQQAFGLLNGFNVDLGVDDLNATLQHARQLPQSNGLVGSVGYCLGGRMAYLMATRTNSNANVGYYGVTIENYLSESDKICAPLMLHIAEEDKYVSKDAQQKIKSALSNNPQVTTYSYAGVDHAFSRINGDHYNEAAATLANQRTADFFKTHLMLGDAAAA